MKNYIFLNLKRFDIGTEYGGVNTLAPMDQWATKIVTSLEQQLGERPQLGTTHSFPIFFPEAHLLPAVKAKQATAPVPVEIGCQGVHHADTATGGNFGAFTTMRTANAAVSAGCSWTIIGHSEQRKALAEMMSMAHASTDHSDKAIHELLKGQIRCALKAKMKVLYCIGETAEQVAKRAQVLAHQITSGTDGLPLNDIVLAYEPIWAIGPGKTPPDAAQIKESAELIKSICSAPLVYGGGLKRENAESIGSIAALDGGLIALTRFTGNIGFYPEEYIEIVDLYVKGEQSR